MRDLTFHCDICTQSTSDTRAEGWGEEIIVGAVPRRAATFTVRDGAKSKRSSTCTVLTFEDACPACLEVIHRETKTFLDDLEKTLSERKDIPF